MLVIIQYKKILIGLFTKIALKNNQKIVIVLIIFIFKIKSRKKALKYILYIQYLI